ncbi:hypothetical protein AGLY_005300 [Aphis glycines]|uniref:Uncharacterized protein n=1 Tax=Aphis glycines TaxID=307491 RepID=A0A6G0TWC8_APHGL|nr:hypothetical protein AGLY_005300 [Aphis glycines]
MFSQKSYVGKIIIISPPDLCVSNADSNITIERYRTLYTLLSYFFWYNFKNNNLREFWSKTFVFSALKHIFWGEKIEKIAWVLNCICSPKINHVSTGNLMRHCLTTEDYNKIYNFSSIVDPTKCERNECGEVVYGHTGVLRGYLCRPNTITPYLGQYYKSFHYHKGDDRRFSEKQKPNIIKNNLKFGFSAYRGFTLLKIYWLCCIETFSTRTGGEHLPVTSSSSPSSSSSFR